MENKKKNKRIIRITIFVVIAAVFAYAINGVMGSEKMFTEIDKITVIGISEQKTRFKPDPSIESNVKYVYSEENDNKECKLIITLQKRLKNPGGDYDVLLEKEISTRENPILGSVEIYFQFNEKDMEKPKIRYHLHVFDAKSRTIVFDGPLHLIE